MAVLLQRQGFEIFRAAEYFTVRELQAQTGHLAGVRHQVDGRRRVLSEVDFTFRGDLYDFQKEAVEAMASHDFGTLAAPPGSGKTVMALGLAQ